VPEIYQPGAFGWTETECQVAEDPVSKTALLTLTDAAIAIGKRDVVVDGKTVPVDLTVGVVAQKPPKYADPATERAPAQGGK
jgi:hypothetical protein